MKQTVLRRLEALEGKAEEDIQVEAVFFYVIDGRKDAIEEKEPVRVWKCPSCECHRLPDETDSDFNNRAAREARKVMQNPFDVVPCLFSN